MREVPSVRPATEAAINARYRPRDYVLRRVWALTDAMGITCALVVAFLFGSEQSHLTDSLLVVATLPAWVLLFRAYGLYEGSIKKINHSVLDDIPRLFQALVIGGLALWLFYRTLAVEQLAPVQQLVFAEVVAFGALGLVLIPCLRWVTRRATMRLFGPERVLFLGDTPVVDAFVRKMRAHPEYSLEPVGLLTRPGDGQRSRLVPVWGDLSHLDLPELLERERIERVIVSPTDVDEETMLEVLQECRRGPVKVSLLPRHVDAMGPSVVIDDVEGLTVLELNPLVLPHYSRLLKRMMDLVGATLLLLVLAPLIALITVAIKLDDRGPILFRQERIGRGGRRFSLLKFRTMVPDAEQRLEELRARSEDPHWLKLEHDPRVTRVGRFLRLTSLDEVPQLWNVIRGDMSLVGPRPLLESEDQQIKGWKRTRLDLAPGITGLWQVLGRTNIPFEEMVKLDYLYVTNWSLWTDVKLLLRTLPIVLSRRGAN